MHSGPHGALHRPRQGVFVVRALMTLAGLTLALVSARQGWAADPCPAPIAELVLVKGQVDLRRRGDATVTAAQRSTMLCPGDSLVVQARSQAALLLNNQSAVRIDQGTTITFATDDNAPLLDVTSGAVYVISRTPRPFKVRTPFINANIEGTEFLVEARRALADVEDASCPVEHDDDTAGLGRDRITVYEGRVRAYANSTSEQVLIGKGESAVATATSGPAVSRLVARPKDSVAWALHVPTIVDARTASTQTACVVRLIDLGRLDEARAKLARLHDADALALSAIVALARNEREEAARLADEAVGQAPNSATAWMARSYARQALFGLDDALASARKAHDISKSALALSRLAELHLAQGDTEAAIALAEDARRQEPGSARAQTVVGFTQLLRIHTRDALEAFELATRIDPADPIPRLGSGLAKVRAGRLEDGRRDIEIAVWLDPGDSVLRSYLGKAFYEERRGRLAEEEFDLARKFDPNDPTPWFYDGLRKGADNRPIEAVADLVESVRLNDRRAVYRSQLLLDDDLAARATSLARIFLEIELPEAATAQAATSLAVDPGNASAHRFLSDAALAEPRHEITRASELLQAQLRQPLSLLPLQAQLSNDRLFALRAEGPNAAGFNEFGSMFVANGSSLQFHGIAGSNSTAGGQAIYSGLRDNIGFGVSALQFRTEGVRPNSDSRETEGSALMQVALSPQTSVQFELAQSDTRTGDIVSRFDPAAFVPDERDHTRLTDLRFGIRHSFSGTSDLLLAVTRRTDRTQADFSGGFSIALKETSTRLELQHLLRAPDYSLISGFSVLEGTATDDVAGDVAQSSPRHVNLYSYSTIALRRDSLYLLAGASYDHMHSRDAGDQSQFNPKLGLIWHPSIETTLRVAAFRVLKRRINSDAGLEPTHVAGFDQYFDDINGTRSRGAAVAGDTRLSEEFRAGFALSGRNLVIPLTNFDQSIEFHDAKERLASAYLHWTVSRRVVASIRVRKSRFERPAEATGAEGFTLADTTEVPLSVKVFGPRGFWSSFEVTHVRQHGTFADASFTPVDGSQTFTIANLVLGYRLPERRGNASLECANLFDRSFRFQDVGLEDARFVPQRTCRLRLSLDF